MFETYQQEKQKSIPYKENPETYVPDIKEIDKMRKDELVRYARSLSAECIEAINKDINRSIIASGKWFLYDSTKNTHDNFMGDPNIGTFKKEYIFGSRVHDDLFDIAISTPNKEFENIISDLSEDKQLAVRELLHFNIIGPTKYSIDNGKLPYEDKIKEYFPVQFYIYTRFLRLVFDYIEKGYNVDIQDEKDVLFATGINVITINI